MWDIFFVMILLAGFQSAAVMWICGRLPSPLSAGASVAAGAAVSIAAALSGMKETALIAPVAGHAVYILCELIRKPVCGRAASALSSVSACLCADMLMLPFFGRTDEEKSWIVCGLIILFSLICCGLYLRGANDDRRRWLISIKEKSRPTYATISLIPLGGVVLQGLILLLCGGDGVMLLAGKYAALILSGSAFLLIQRLCAEHYTLTNENRMMFEWQRGAADYMNTVRAQRHDFNIHLHAIDGMIGSGRYDQCRRYVSDMVADAGDVNDIMPVYDAMIGSMLYNMRKEARLKGSDIYYDIKYDMKNVVCSAYVCNRLIGNIIRNALDALDNEQAKRQGIKVSIFRRSGNAIIAVTNYFNGDEQAVLRAFEPGWSGKTGHEGIGLAASQRTLKKYGGRIMAEWQDSSVTFIMHIPVKYLPEEGEYDKDGTS